MQLDFNATNGQFLLRIPRGEFSWDAARKDYGLNFSSSASTPQEAVLFTDQPYAAVPFYQHATSRAQAQLINLQTKIVASSAIDSAMHFDMPYDKELWGFQRADLEYGLSCKHWLDADQPGLGKTPTAIVYANTIQARRVLVLCPAQVRRQWEKRVREWMTLKWDAIINTVLTSRRGIHPNAAWTIVSYDLAATRVIGGLLAEGKYDLLILDEAHYLKTVDANRTRAIFGGGRKELFTPLASRAEVVLALTGTPLPNRPREAFTVARGLCYDSIDWLSEEDFDERFNPSMQTRVIDPVSGIVKVFNDERFGRLAELQARLRGNFMVRHMKREVLTQLKLPVFDLVQAEETGAVKQALAAESLLDIDPEDLDGADITALGHIAEARRLMGVAIAPQVAEYIRMCIEGGEDKIVLFGHHKEVLDIWEHELADLGTVRIDGSTSASRREFRKERFINDPTVRVIIGNILSLGTGTDGLQEVCWHAVIGEPDWTPGINLQAFDRLDRAGQKGTVLGEIFVAPNSLAEKVLASALRKLRVTDQALDKRLLV